MRIAVLGGGTAGFIAAAHLTRNVPEAELLHVFDSRIPTIGVGEGTTPRFPVWFEEVTGLGFPDLAERCAATLKKGTRFDGWGLDGSAFLNRFQPTRLIGYHFDATEVVRVLGEYVRAERVDARVEEVSTSADGVRVRLADDTTHRCDYVFDARGFPRLTDGDDPEDLIQLDWMPTGRANLRWLPPGGLSEVTRAAARPHGWIFQIPLRHTISCGYIFNPRISSDAEVDADFTAFLHEEGVPTWSHRGMLDFPNFLRRRLFDGRVFWVGNAASFLEPLEATAISTAIVEVRSAVHWIIEHGLDSKRGPRRGRGLQRSIGVVCLPQFALRRVALRVRLPMGHRLLAIRPARPRTRPRQRRGPAPSCRHGGVCRSRAGVAGTRPLGMRGPGSVGPRGLPTVERLSALRQFLRAQLRPGGSRNRLLRCRSRRRARRRGDRWVVS